MAYTKIKGIIVLEFSIVYLNSISDRLFLVHTLESLGPEKL